MKNFAKNFDNNTDLKDAIIGIGETKGKVVQAIFKRLFFMIMILMGISFLSMFYLYKTTAFFGVNSHIIIGGRSESIYEEEKAKKRQMEYYSITFLFITTMCGLLATFIYNYILHYLISCVIFEILIGPISTLKN